MNQVRPESATLPLQVDAQDFYGNMADYMRRAREGASFLITSDGEVVAELHPPPPPPKPHRRLFGAMRGQIWIANDFDTWPEGFIEEMVEGNIFPPEEEGE